MWVRDTTFREPDPSLWYCLLSLYMGIITCLFAAMHVYLNLTIFTLHSKRWLICMPPNLLCFLPQFCMDWLQNWRSNNCFNFHLLIKFVYSRVVVKVPRTSSFFQDVVTFCNHSCSLTGWIVVFRSLFWVYLMFDWRVICDRVGFKIFGWIIKWGCVTAARVIEKGCVSVILEWEIWINMEFHLAFFA